MRSDDSRLTQLESITKKASSLRESITIGARSGPRLLLARQNLITFAGDELSPGGGGSGAGVSQPTEAKALSEQSRAEAIKAALQLAELEELVDRAEQALERALAIASMSTISAYHAPNNLRGCRQCATVKGDDGRVHPLSFQQIAHKATELCEWCYRWQFGYGPSRPGYGVPPHPDLLRWHLDHPGGPDEKAATPPRALVRDLMPTAYASREEAKRLAGKTCTRKVVTHLGVDHCCSELEGHEGECRFPTLPASAAAAAKVAS